VNYEKNKNKSFFMKHRVHVGLHNCNLHYGRNSGNRA